MCEYFKQYLIKKITHYVDNPIMIPVREIKNRASLVAAFLEYDEMSPYVCRREVFDGDKNIILEKINNKYSRYKHRYDFNDNYIFDNITNMNIVLNNVYEDEIKAHLNRDHIEFYF